MAYNFPESVVENVLNSVDIVDVISDYVELRKSGANFKALCPFHSEKTPSFTVSPGKQMFYCFGCQTGGNVFSFIMKHDKASFPEALKTLAEKSGISVPSAWGKDETRTLFLYKINEAASDFFRSRLSSDESGEKARKYLDSRKFDNGVAEQFSLGFAPRDGRGMRKMLDEKFSKEQIEKSGLISKAGGRPLFSNRLVFPILNIRGRVAGFGARALDDSVPKYINSPETGVYSKGDNLYGLNFAKNHISRSGKAILVEGYFDLIRVVQAGFSNAVASLGTALTPQQVQLLRRYTREVIVAYDGDESGVRSALRMLDSFLDSGITAKTAVFPEGDDPDSYIMREGKDKFAGLLESASDMLSFKMNRLSDAHDPQTVDGRVKIVDELLPSISRIGNAVERSEYVKILAEHLSIDEDSLMTELKNIRSRKNKEKFPSLELQSLTPLVAERTLLQLLLEGGGDLTEFNVDLGVEDFTQPECREVAAIMLKLGSAERSKVMSMVQDEKLNKFLARLLVNPAPSADRKKDVRDCIKKIKKQKEKRKRAEIQKQIAREERAGNEAQVRKLIQEFQDLLKNGPS